MKTDWTPAQRNAIDARGMQVLVSAAAGSGKTSVLTERVKNILCDTDNPCSVSQLLVVTFTRAAATEMRDRIYGALKESVSLNNNNTDYLRRQMILLPTADICTIDSFCAKIVKENFADAGVSVDFRVLDEKDINEITSQAVNSVIDELYEENDEAFNSLTKMFLNERNDNLLAEVIITLYKYSRSYPSPFTWLDMVADSFSADKSPDETMWADVLYKYVGLFADYHYKNLKRCVSLMEDSGGFSPDYFVRFNSSADNLLNLKNTVHDRNWDGMVSVIREGIVVKVPARNTKVDNDLKTLTQDAFSDFEKDAEKLYKHTLPLTDEHKRDSSILYPIVKKLCDSVKMLSMTLDKIKSEKNAYGFDDILHKCIDLLVDFNGNGWTRTDLAVTLSKKYKEILIDEYQDTNEAQNIIFEALSDNKKNMYVVGDVKQSIYRFRLASPELFMALRNDLPEYDGKCHPSQITLDSNFRSRKGIDEAVNYIFTSLMSLSVGEIDYNDKEKLTFGASWFEEKHTPDTEVICLDCDNMRAGEITQREAENVAAYIERVIKSGVTVTTKTGKRAIRSSDICILLRSVKNKADYYVDALRKKNITASAVIDGDTSESKEMRVLISLIKTINNPLMDISLIAVLLSPLFGFTVDELAEIRMINKNTDLYSCLVAYASTNKKAAEFLNKLRLYRNIAASYPINEFVKFVIDDTSFKEIYSAVSGGDVRRDNIRGFQKFADDFTANSNNSLNAFVRYIDNAVENGSLRNLNTSNDCDGVKIMSIHKSKGLEFPYVIIADCAKSFNKRDSYNSLTLARETGIGIKIRDDELFTKYHTISSAATEKAILFGSASEELRVLYVAMTRAKEHLTFVFSVSGKQLVKRVRMNNILSRDNSRKLHPYAVFRANSMAEWLLSCFVNHKDCENIRELCEYSTVDFDGDSFGVDSTTQSVNDDIFLNDKTDIYEPVAPVDYSLLKNIEDKLSVDYQYNCEGILAKQIASSTEKSKANAEYFAKSKPEFLKNKITGADRGNAIHKFLELCDFKNTSSDIESEKAKLLKEGFITPKELEVIDDNAIRMFFCSHIGQRLLSADEVLKEYEFSFIKKAGELYSGLNSNVADEDIVVQGKLDCAFAENNEYVLIDYKSDKVNNPEVLVEQYKPQIEIYAEAIAECTGCKVKERYLYSFSLKKFISI